MLAGYKKLLLITLCFVLLAGSALAQVIPVPKGFTRVQNREVTDAIFTISPPTRMEDPVTAFVRTTDMNLLLGKKMENRPAAYGTLKVTGFKLDRAKFQKYQALVSTGMKEELSKVDVSKRVETDLAAMQKKYGTKMSLKVGSNAFIGTEKISDTIYLHSFLSANNKVKTDYFNYVVDYYHCFVSVYARSRMYTLTLVVPVKGAKDFGPVKDVVRSWAKQFAAKNKGS